MPYRFPKQEWQSVRAAACQLLPTILSAAGTGNPCTERIVNEFFDTLIWKYSEAAGKYQGCPLWTRQAVARFHANPKSKPYDGLVHEHAFPKRVIINEIRKHLGNEEAALQVFQQMTIAAIVTKDPEDVILRKSGWQMTCPDGSIECGAFWERYLQASQHPEAPPDAFQFIDHPGLASFLPPESLAAFKATGILLPEETNSNGAHSISMKSPRQNS